MIKFSPILFLIASCSTQSDKTKSSQLDSTNVAARSNPKVISDSTNTLTGKVEILELEYIVWGCACANWVAPADFLKYQDNKLVEHCIFIEPSNDSLELPLFFDPSRHKIKVKGQFYTRPGYPKGTLQLEEPLEKAKVFRYTEIKVNEKNIHYSHKDDETLTLNYNAIGCTCAQWSESKYNDNPGKRELLYVERADNKLINADTLFNGSNFPIQIRVTGQFVTEVGYPSGYNPTKGSPEPGKVFRYSKIKVLAN